MEDFAHQMRWLADAAYPDPSGAGQPPPSLGQALNTHRSLYMTLEFHYTPKHGSWLNMAEIEFSV